MGLEVKLAFDLPSLIWHIISDLVFYSEIFSPLYWALCKIFKYEMIGPVSGQFGRSPDLDCCLLIQRSTSIEYLTRLFTSNQPLYQINHNLKGLFPLLNLFLYSKFLDEINFANLLTLTIDMILLTFLTQQNLVYSRGRSNDLYLYCFYSTQNRIIYNKPLLKQQNITVNYL